MTKTAGDRLELKLAEGVTMVFRYIPPCPEGFLMGAREYLGEQPVHRVTLSEGFWLGETLVTQAQFGLWELPKPHENYFNHEAPEVLPVDQISWDDASEYCQWLNEIGFAKDQGRAGLPAEVQWEYACRAGSDTEYWNGDGEAALAEVAWYGGNAGSKTHPVGSKPANPWGLNDMHGNLWEWCADEWDDAAYGKLPLETCAPCRDTDASEQSSRVQRGGSWMNSAAYCRSAYRNWLVAGGRYWFHGFRVGLFPWSVKQPTNSQHV